MEVFKRFEADDIAKANPAEVSTGLWTSDTGSLTTFYTSSTQTASDAGQHFFDVYHLHPLTASTEVQFGVAYGHVDGYGAPILADDDNALLPTKATYFQYRNILLEPDDTKFTFLEDSSGANFDADEIFVINIQRQRLKEKLDPGNWVLKLKSGSADVMSLIDDSGQTLGENFGTSGRVFNVVSGSLTGVSGSTTALSTSVSGGFGLVYPDVGIIVLNPRALFVSSASVETDTGTGSVLQNQKLLLDSIQLGVDFQARSAEDVSSTHYFVRLRNKEFNYSNNPSFYNSANGAIINTTFIQNPVVYVTTIGLYNDANELLAVAKLSQPFQKSFDREALIRVKLDW